MKILYHHRTASKDGQNVHVEELIAALRRGGHEIEIVAPAGASATAFGGSSGWVRRLKIMLPRAIYELLELGYSLIAYHRLARAIKRQRPDVLYERYNLFMLAGAWAARRHGLPFLVEVNAPLSEERSLYGGLALRKLAVWSERTVWRAADAAFPVTDQLANYLRVAGVDDERIEVIANGVDRSKFSRDIERTEIRRGLGLDDRLVLGFTGFLRTWHGLPRVLDAMARMERTDTHLLVVGDGPARAELEAHARTLQLTDRLTILGLVERDRIPSLTAAMDIALQPQVVAYASPLKLFEYLALARPVIAPDQPNIREILTHEVDALLFDPAAANGFIDAIERLCLDDVLRDRLGRAAANLVDDRELTWDGNARRVEQRALSLLARRDGIELPSA